MTYKLIVDDNFHYMDKDERYTHGEFETLEAAVEAAKKVVDVGLLHSYVRGMSAAALYGQYTMFGEDPWISGAETNPFSAWEYAKTRCEVICAANA
jgi:hypothetical protein